MSITEIERLREDDDLKRLSNSQKKKSYLYARAKTGENNRNIVSQKHNNLQRILINDASIKKLIYYITNLAKETIDFS